MKYLAFAIALFAAVAYAAPEAAADADAEADGSGYGDFETYGSASPSYWAKIIRWYWG